MQLYRNSWNNAKKSKEIFPVEQSEILTTEDEESNSETESENEENLMEENQFLKRETRANYKGKQMKLRDLSQKKK